MLTMDAVARTPEDPTTSAPDGRQTVIYLGRDLNDLVGGAQAKMVAELEAAGVRIEHLPTNDLTTARKAGGEALQVLLDRLRTATTVLIGTGHHSDHPLAITMLRQHIPEGTWVVRERRADLAGLIYFPGVMAGTPFRAMTLDGMIPALFAKYVAPHVAASPPGVVMGGPTNDARPLPYRGPTYGFTDVELYDTRGKAIVSQARSGALDPFVAVVALREMVQGEIDQHRQREQAPLHPYFPTQTWLAKHLCWMMRHVPTDRLGRMGDPSMRGVWTTLGEGEAGHRHDATVARAIWEALIRDGGRETLTALPTELTERRELLEREWDEKLEQARAAVPERSFSFQSRAGSTDWQIEAMLDSPLIPQEDPFEGGVVGPAYLPTLHTLRVARRYRPATEVVRLAQHLFGSRPFVRDDAGGQLRSFVAESPPTSAEEVAEWSRLLYVLREKRTTYRRVAGGCLMWDILPPEIYTHVADGDPLRFGAGRHPALRLPWLDEQGRRLAAWRGVDLPGAEDAMRRAGGRLRVQPGGPHHIRPAAGPAVRPARR